MICEMTIMAETLLSIIDKLATVSQKLWHQEEIAQAPGADDHVVAEAKRRISILNLQRNALVEEGDIFLRDAISGANKKLVFPQMKDYGKGK
jgi:hypothetical protein